MKEKDAITALAALAQPTRLSLVDIAVAQIAVDAHLLTRQRIEAEPSCDLGDALRDVLDPKLRER